LALKFNDEIERRLALEMCVGLRILCFNTLFEDGTLVPKHVGIGMKCNDLLGTDLT